MPNFSQYYKKDNRSSGLQPHFAGNGAVFLLLICLLTIEHERLLNDFKRLWRILL